MQQLLHIFRKDVRRLWPYLIPVLLLDIYFVAASSRGNVSFWGGSSGHALNILIPLAWWTVTALLFHEEQLAEDRAFWLTRPYRRGAILGAKLLFVAVFLIGPMAIAEAAVLSLAGFGLQAYAGEMLWSAVLRFLWLVVPAAALAAVTNSLAQFLLCVIAGFISISLTANHYSPMAYWQARLWIQSWTALSILLPACLAVLAVQYAWRRTTPARIGGVAGWLLAIAAAVGVSQSIDTLFAIQTAVAPRRASADEIRIALDPARGPRKGISARFSDGAAISIPVRVDHPVEKSIAVFHTDVELSSPSGFRWRSGSGWQSMAAFLWVHEENGYRLEWQMAREAVARGPMELRAVVSVNLFRGRSTEDRRGWGRCFESPSPRFFTGRESVCTVAYRTPAHSRISFRDGKQQERSYDVNQWDSLVPFPHNSLFDPVVVIPIGEVKPDGFSLETWEIDSHLRKEFRLENLRLSDYVMLPE